MVGGTSEIGYDRFMAWSERIGIIPIRCDVAIYVCMALDSRFRGKDELGIGASQHGYGY